MTLHLLPPALRRRAARWGLLSTALLATVVAPLALLGPTAAAATTPVTPTFTAPVEPYPSYTSEQGCLSGVRPAVTATIDQILIPTYGGASWRFLTQRTCNPTSFSGHDNGTALDWMNRYDIADEKARVDAFIGWLLATDSQDNTHALARRLGVMYLIWNNRIFEMYRPGAGWTSYNTWVGGAEKPCAQLPAATYDTICHRDHLHISFTPAGAAMQTSYWKQATQEPMQPVSTTSTLTITNPVITTTAGSTVTLRGSTVNAGDQVQVYIRRPGQSNWIAILNPVASDAAKQFSVSYTANITHYVRVFVGTSGSNLGRVIIS